MKRLLISSILLVTLSSIMLTPWSFAQSISQGNGDLRVMTYNIDEGTDYIEIQAAQNAEQFLFAIGQTITQVRTINTKSRMQAIANQIVASAPTLVSLQEVNQWFTGPFNPMTGQCGELTLESDMLTDVMKALEDRGAHYEVANIGKQWEFTGPYAMPGFIPPSTFLCVGVIDYVVILARTDLPKLAWSNPQSQQYVATLMFPTPVATVPFPRAWVSVNVNFNGRAFRFVGTHLDSVHPGIRRAQAEELRLGAANSFLPVIIAMDSNSPAAPLPPDPVYLDFLSAGFVDAWAEKFPDLPGFTTGQDQFLKNPESKLNQRIDLILTMGPIVVQRIALFGVTQASKTPDGLWPSDHAAVVAQLNVQRRN